MRITKVYTRVGDKGTTRLAGGQEVPKDGPRIAAYGATDELNAIVGLARTFSGRSEADPLAKDRIERMLHQVQNDLFEVGADLATLPADRKNGAQRIGDGEVKRLEEWIDALNEDLGPLQEFILPGGGPVGAFFHQARTVCRRAERAVAALLRAEPDPGDATLRYLNRLGDYFFVAGRWAAKSLGEEEYLWEKKKRK